MKSSDDELDDFQHRNKKSGIKRSVSPSSSTSISNSFLDKYSEREDKKPKPGFSTNSIKVGIYILYSMNELPVFNIHKPKELKHLVSLFRSQKNGKAQLLSKQFSNDLNVLWR